jgi:hypothetical protein
MVRGRSPLSAVDSRATPKPSTATTMIAVSAPARTRTAVPARGEASAASPDGTTRTRYSRPQPPVRVTNWSTTGTSACVLIRVPMTPIGLAMANRNSAAVHNAGAATAASSTRPRLTSARNSHTASAKSTDEPMRMTAAIGSGTSWALR